MSNTYDWHDIQSRAAKFAAKWVTETDEKGEAKTFWDDFLREIFNIERRQFMNFEKTSRRASTNRKGFIDLFWKGKFLVEHKSAIKNSEKDFDDAFEQALDYIKGMPKDDHPRYITLCNFQRFRLFDTQTKKIVNFDTEDLPRFIKEFAFIPDAVNALIEREIKANVEAAELMGRLHDAVEKDDYKGRDLELLLVRLLFCLFAEDTKIFSEKMFTQMVSKHITDDGKSLGQDIVHLFEVLNTEFEQRPTDTPKHLKLFPYVNGGLFERPLSKKPNFTLFTLQALFDCCRLDWSEISPAIFGSLFQSVMNGKERRNLGAHYTSEINIRRLIDPLFMDALWAEFESVKSNLKRLRAFHEKLGKLRFLDPACGCGNFLVVTYKALRLLELEVIRTLFADFVGDIDRKIIKVNSLRQVRLGSFFGIEIEESSFLIAQTAMWLVDHQCNQLLEKEFNEYIPSVPLPKGAAIKYGNSLQVDWQSAFPNVDFIIGNPPFIGKHLQNEAQKADLDLIFNNLQGSGNLDYVTGWYIKAAEYMKATPSVKTAFVSTNSIAQGEQVGVLWKELFENYKIKILFAHQTFKWNNEAKGIAAVHCVIIGFAPNTDGVEKAIFEYEDISGEPVKVKAKNINPYLVEGKDLWIESRTNPLCDVPKMMYGSKPVDDGNLFFDDDEIKEFLLKEPNAEPWIKPVISSHEFLNGKNRWCLWLKDILPNELQLLPEVLKRVEKVKNFRKQSTKAQTKESANTPTVFAEIRQPVSNYVVIPLHSSENRAYIPFGFFDSTNILHNSCTALPNADLFLFGSLTSKMHMAWVKYVCGRIKSDFRYSNLIVYNNYPFPEGVNDSQKQKVETAAQAVLDIRKTYTMLGKSLAQLYDPLSMPPDLKAAHDALDKAVDDCYGKTKFTSDAKRVGYLFELYDVLVKGEKMKVKK
jgi:N-6 DNA Methylase